MGGKRYHHHHLPTLVEIMVSLAVFAFMALGVAYGVTAGMRDNSASSIRQDVITKTQALLDQANPLRNLCSTTQNISLNTGSTLPVNIVCANTPVTVGGAIQNVNVARATAAWTEKGGQRSVTIQR